MIGENATVINIQFLHVFTKLTLPPSLIYGLERQTIRSFYMLLPKNVGSFMRVSTVYQKNLHMAVIHSVKYETSLSLSLSVFMNVAYLYILTEIHVT